MSAFGIALSGNQRALIIGQNKKFKPKKSFKNFRLDEETRPKELIKYSFLLHLMT